MQTQSVCWSGGKRADAKWPSGIASVVVLLSANRLALADSTVSGISFNAKSTFYVDSSATLMSCGMAYTATFVSDKQYATQIHLAIGKDRISSLTTLTSEYSRSTNAYAPVVNTNSFFNIGDAPTIKLDPYNLMTVPNDGMSQFSFRFDENDINRLAKAMKKRWKCNYDPSFSR
ncbi:hypothetical protein [Azospirillum sp. TSO5]|uniref:hypothetical protein n=1 Tax=Azospirillum sp. TSO5 TaxID=716760 RepID=UPI0011B251A4|nr:hypothetical protein [Azospirillum sp. TSO5]